MRIIRNDFPLTPLIICVILLKMTTNIHINIVNKIKNNKFKLQFPNTDQLSIFCILISGYYDKKKIPLLVINEIFNTNSIFRLKSIRQ